ncbi:hypothetical protein BC834DRAFT_325181 [Gloeopeniophorella convolvens]|nr:hypothetical protein BC834DRAFT_325181 [Gloeopeniophorella convolvens]
MDARVGKMLLRLYHELVPWLDDLPRYSPGVCVDSKPGDESSPLDQTLIARLLGDARSIMPQFLPPVLFTRTWGAFGPQLHSATDTQDSGMLRDVLKGFDDILDRFSPRRNLYLPRQNRMVERLLWRCFDIADGQGFGLSVELFLITLTQLLPRLPTSGSHHVFFILYFGTLTSDWNKHMRHMGTRRIILHLLCDTVLRNQRAGFSCGFPQWLVDEVTTLARNILRGDKGRISTARYKSFPTP